MELTPDDRRLRYRADILRLGGGGILHPDDIPELSAGVGRVLYLMRDGQWHTRQEIDLAAGEHGVPAAEGTRRLRELRQWFVVERRRLDGRQFAYRLKPKTKVVGFVQQDFFEKGGGADRKRCLSEDISFARDGL